MKYQKLNSYSLLEEGYDIRVFYNTNINNKETDLDGRELFKYERYIYDLFINKIETNDKFNIVIYKIKNDGSHSSLYLWENEKSHQNLLDYAEVFYQWVNERMMSMIFEYEKDNDLVPTEYDSDGDLEYLSSWDSGVFTFHINEKNNLDYKVVLTKDGKERTLDLPLRDYFIEGILDHYKVTNNELSDEWKPWNTMILKSLHYDIPYDKRDEFVNYILE